MLLEIRGALPKHPNNAPYVQPGQRYQEDASMVIAGMLAKDEEKLRNLDFASYVATKQYAITGIKSPDNKAAYIIAYIFLSAKTVGFTKDSHLDRRIDDHRSFSGYRLQEQDYKNPYLTTKKYIDDYPDLFKNTLEKTKKPKLTSLLENCCRFVLVILAFVASIILFPFALIGGAPIPENKKERLRSEYCDVGGHTELNFNYKGSDNPKGNYLNWCDKLDVLKSTITSEYKKLRTSILQQSAKNLSQNELKAQGVTAEQLKTMRFPNDSETTEKEVSDKLKSVIKKKLRFLVTRLRSLESIVGTYRGPLTDHVGPLLTSKEWIDLATEYSPSAGENAIVEEQMQKLETEIDTFLENMNSNKTTIKTAQFDEAFNELINVSYLSILNDPKYNESNSELCKLHKSIVQNEQISSSINDDLSGKIELYKNAAAENQEVVAREDAIPAINRGHETISPEGQTVTSPTSLQMETATKRLRKVRFVEDGLHAARVAGSGPLRRNPDEQKPRGHGLK